MCLRMHRYTPTHADQQRNGTCQFDVGNLFFVVSVKCLIIDLCTDKLLSRLLMFLVLYIYYSKCPFFRTEINTKGYTFTAHVCGSV